MAPSVDRAPVEINDGSEKVPEPDGSEQVPKRANGTNGAATVEDGVTVLHPSLVLRTKETPDTKALGLEEELPGWHGYVEWENYPERKKQVKEFMKKFDFAGVSCFL